MTEITARGDSIKCRTFSAASFGGKEYFYMMDDGVFLKFGSSQFVALHADADWRNREYDECTTEEFSEQLSSHIGRQAANIQHLQSLMSASCELLHMLMDVPRHGAKQVGHLAVLGYKGVIDPVDVVIGSVG